MSAKKTAQPKSKHTGYTYPEFVIDENSGQVAVNLVDTASGRVVRHIPSVELDKLTRGGATSAGNADA